MLKKIFFVLLACSVVVQCAAITDGSLDTSFGTNGKVTTDFSGGTDLANALIVQPDGTLVAAGKAGTDFALARYNADGSLDTSFGTNGKVTTDFGGTDEAFALILQLDGKLVAAGSAGTDFALARYNADGSLDTSFGTNGKVTTDFAGGTDAANALILQPDGKLVAAGKAGTDFALARYNADGSLDTSFGTNGKVTTDFAGGTDITRALILQPDGKLVAAGSAGNDFALARYNADGSLDTSFGTNGKVTTDFASNDVARALILQPDGKLVAAGIGAAGFALARYNADGSLDNSFGTNGKVTTAFSGETDVSAFALSLQPDGKLVAAGSGYDGTIDAPFGFARYNADGSLDTSFGTSGLVTTDFAGGIDSARALIVQPDGKLVAAGSAATDFGLARYLVPSLEISSVARDIRAKYRIVLPSDRNGTVYEI